MADSETLKAKSVESPDETRTWIVGEEPYVGVDFSSETERHAKEG